MHGLDVIIKRNQAAAVRELSHAIEDAGGVMDAKATAIVQAMSAWLTLENTILARTPVQRVQSQREGDK